MPLIRPPSRGVGTPGHPPRESTEPAGTKEASRGWGMLRPLRHRSRTPEGLPLASRWLVLDCPSVGGAWPGSAAVSEPGLVLGPDLEGRKIHSRCDLVPVLVPSALTSKTLR